MKNITFRSVMTICCVCIFLILMCAFFVDDAHAAAVTKGTTTQKEQTVRIKISAGTCIITVKDTDSWVYAQLQTTGSNKLGTAVAGEMLLADIGQQRSFTVPVRKAGTYYLYLHGTNKGATYSVQHIAPGGKLKSGFPKIGTSYADNRTMTFYRIKVPETGTLRVTVKDSSYRYPGYSKIKLKKEKKLYSGEENLIRGLGYSTVYGVTKGTYYVGVRSSSELYKITATFNKTITTKSGRNKGTAAVISRNAKARGIIVPGSKLKRWYKVTLPAKSGTRQKRSIVLSASNNNHNLRGGIRFTVYTAKKNGKTTKSSYTLNNASYTKKISMFRGRERKVFIRVSAVKGATGSYSITWK